MTIQAPSSSRTGVVTTADSLATTPNPTQRQGDDGDQEAKDADIDPESYRYWKRAVASLPPMTSEEIAAVGAVLRRIDARVRRGQQPHQ